MPAWISRVSTLSRYVFAHVMSAAVRWRATPAMMMTMTMTHLLEIEARVSLVTLSDARPLAVKLRASRIMIRCAHFEGALEWFYPRLLMENGIVALLRNKYVCVIIATDYREKGNLRMSWKSEWKKSGRLFLGERSFKYEIKSSNVREYVAHFKWWYL